MDFKKEQTAKKDVITITLTQEEYDALHYALNQYSQQARKPYLTWAEWASTFDAQGYDEADKRRENIIEDMRNIRF